MKKILLLGLLTLGVARGAAASPFYENTFDGSSTTLKMMGRFAVRRSTQPSVADTLNIDGPRGLFSWLYGINASTGVFTGTGNTTYSLTTSSGINVAAGGVTAPWFSGTTFYGNAATASALAATPSAASSGFLCRGIDVSGNCLPAHIDTTTNGVAASTKPWSSGAAATSLALYAPLAGATFTGAVGITNQALTLTGANGNVVTAASVTAQGLFVNSARISSIASGTQCLHADSSGNITGTGSDCGGASNAVLTATQTFSGFNTFVGSTTLTGFVTHFVTTFTYVPAGSTSQAAFLVAFATVTATYSGKYDVECQANVGYSNNGAGLAHISFLLNGGYVAPLTSTLGLVTEYDPGGRVTNHPFFRFPKANMVGSKSVAISFMATIAGSVVWPAATGNTINPFFRCAEVY